MVVKSEENFMFLSSDDIESKRGDIQDFILLELVPKLVRNKIYILGIRFLRLHMFPFFIIF